METRIIYKQNGYTVSLTNPGKSRDLVIFMSGQAETGPQFRRFSTEMEFVAENDLTAAFVRFNQPSWYQGLEARRMFQAVGLMSRSFDRTIVVGSDMGAYGAMALAEYVRVDHVLAFSPVSTIDPRHGPRDYRFDEDFAALGSFAELRKHHGKAYTVFYDPIGPEARQLAHLRLPQDRLRTVTMQGATGQSQTILQESGIWAQVLSDILADRETPNLDRTSALARRRHPEYLRGMALANMEQRPGVAQWAIGQLQGSNRGNMARQLQARFARTHEPVRRTLAS